MARVSINPGFILSLALAETIAERDPTFLGRLGDKLLQLRAARGGGRAGDQNAVTTIDAFLQLLDDPAARHA